MATKVKLKFFVDTQAQKVLFAEAGKDLIDFLFNFLSLPVGTVARLLNEKGMVGSSINVYKSIENLRDSFLQLNKIKNSLLNISAPEIPLLLSNYDLKVRSLYSCYNHSYVADVPNLLCPVCNWTMTRALTYVPLSSRNTGISEGGFLKSFVSFMVMDNLEFVPISTQSLFALLNKSNVKDVSALDVIDVELDVDEGLKVLKLSLECETVLTSYLGTLQQIRPTEACEECKEI